MLKKKVLLDENFENFSIGKFPYDYSPLREYHFVQPKGYRGKWREATVQHRWGEMGNWKIVKEGDQHCMELCTLRDPENSDPPIIVAGDQTWKNYILTSCLKPLSLKGVVGVVFCFQNGRNYYAFVLRETKKIQLIKRKEEVFKIIKEIEYEEECGKRHTIEVQLGEGEINCSVGENVNFKIEDKDFTSGKVGFTATAPARFSFIKVEISSQTAENLVRRKHKREIEVKELKKSLPKPKLWRRIDTPGFGAGRSVRFGDLIGNGKLDIVIAQNMRKVQGDSYSMISCLTALTMEGDVLWQRGEPSLNHALVTNDLPFQIVDLDGDGQNEVVCAMDFNILVLEGKTGEIKATCPTPYSRRLDKPFGFGSEDAFFRIVGDSIAVCNISSNFGKDLLIKDRYNNLWAYDKNLNPLWSYTGNTGHFPVCCDINQDGKDEILIGYTLLSCEGNILWTLEDLKDHMDSAVIGRFGKNGGLLIALAAGEDGFLLVDSQGKVLTQERTGHVQAVTVGNYIPELSGLQLCTTTYWGSPGITCVYTAEGEKVSTWTPMYTGSLLHPVNWSGDGQELILISASHSYGGLFDGYGRRIISFPEDNHPQMCCAALDITEDCRDEIILWDPEKIYIYTQACSFQGKRIYSPLRTPALINQSNYSGTLSLPRWKNNSE